MFASPSIAGILLLRLIARYSGVICSPLPMFTHFAVYGSSSSSSAMRAFCPFGVVYTYASIMGRP